MNDAESERRRLARTDLAARLSKPLDFALAAHLPSEAALIAAVIHALLMNKTADLLIAIQTTKPGA